MHDQDTEDGRQKTEDTTHERRARVIIPRGPTFLSVPPEGGTYVFFSLRLQPTSSALCRRVGVQIRFFAVLPTIFNRMKLTTPL